MLGLITTYGANNMILIQTFVATIAFAVALIAFCAGSALAVWATSSSHIGDAAAAKLSGYFVMVLAVIALVGTSYYISTGLLSSGPVFQQPMMWHHWNKDMSQHQHHMQKHNNAPNSKSKGQ